MSVDRSALDALEPGPPPTGRGPWRAVARRFARDRAALAGAAVLAVLVVACTAGALLAPSPTDQDLALGASGPSADHWFGTDRLGRDMLARVLHGGRVSLRIGLGVAVLSGALGTAVGLVAGYRRGRLDALLMRATDLWLALPALPFLAVAVSIGEVGPVDLTGVTGMVLVLSLLLWSSIARVVRGWCCRCGSGGSWRRPGPSAPRAPG
ncbi:MAG: hypothetical protein M5U14_05065 [Acidimicrobiia bacterium]|nr:hypothetical protein [Acidimicrobiia bacterium]